MVHISTAGYDYATAYEIQLIETYLPGKSSLVNSSTALRILKTHFNPIEVERKNAPSGYFYSSDQTETVFHYYSQRYPKKFEKQKIHSYMELVNLSRDYCERYELI